MNCVAGCYRVGARAPLAMMSLIISELEILRWCGRTPSARSSSSKAITHVPTGKWYGAYPGMPNISHENTVDVGDYSENEIRQMAERILAGRLE